MDRIIHQKIDVHYDYPVLFTRNVFGENNPALAECLNRAAVVHPHPRMMVYIDHGVVAALPDIPVRATAYFRQQVGHIHLAAPPVILPGGEMIKSDRRRIELMLREMADARLDRHSYVIVIGGGAVLDAVGYAASLVHRGVRVVRLPTTVLSQNDGGVGVKTAINDKAGKNFLGTFAPPFAVINDLTFLHTLPDEDWRSGIAEAFKVACIKDATFFAWLAGHAVRLASRDEALMEELVYRCAELHLNHIRMNGDPFEMGQARPLDFGHWSAHQLEAMTNYKVGHGQAVAIGIMLDALYAVRTGLIDASVAEQLFHGLSDSGFVLWHDAMAQRYPSGRLLLLDGLERFREHLGGTLCITVPCGIGSSMELTSIDEAVMESALLELHGRVSAVHAQPT